jgi:prepilin-type N-terminal cleavage/methylation domain-containing protein
MRAVAGFTLVEILVVVVLIGLLLALLLPALMSSRDTVRGLTSAVNLEQIGIALHKYEAAKGMFPPSWTEPNLPDGDNVDGWSIHALLLPYIEEVELASRINYQRSYSEYTHDGNFGHIITVDGTESHLTASRVPIYVSPDEPRDEARLSDGEPNHYPVNYAANLGTFFVWDPGTGEVGNGAFAPGRGFSSSAFQNDGMTKTIAFAEVKAWQPYARNNGNDVSNANIANLLAAVTPDNDGRLNMFADVSDMQALVQAAHGAGNFKTNSGHTEWVDGRVHQTGFTTVFGPNEKVLVDVAGDGVQVDVDWTNWQEGKNRGSATADESPTWAAVTARSYREQGVYVLFMGGGTKLISPDINIGVWRAYSTRNGGEMISAEEQVR